MDLTISYGLPEQKRRFASHAQAYAFIKDCRASDTPWSAWGEDAGEFYDYIDVEDHWFDPDRRNITVTCSACGDTHGDRDLLPHDPQGKTEPSQVHYCPGCGTHFLRWPDGTTVTVRTPDIADAIRTFEAARKTNISSRVFRPVGTLMLYYDREPRVSAFRAWRDANTIIDDESDIHPDNDDF